MVIAPSFLIRLSFLSICYTLRGPRVRFTALAERADDPRAWVTRALTGVTYLSVCTLDVCTAILYTLPIETDLTVITGHFGAGQFDANPISTDLVQGTTHPGTAAHTRTVATEVVFGALNASTWVGDTITIDAALIVCTAGLFATVIDAFTRNTHRPGSAHDVCAGVDAASALTAFAPFALQNVARVNACTIDAGESLGALVAGTGVGATSRDADTESRAFGLLIQCSIAVIIDAVTKLLGEFSAATAGVS